MPPHVDGSIVFARLHQCAPPPNTSLDLPESTSQTASRSGQPFLHSYFTFLKSVTPQVIHGDFSIFQDGGRRHLGFLKFEISNSRAAQKGLTVSQRQIWSKSVKPLPRYDDFSIFPRWWPSAILGLLCVFGPPTKGIWWSLSLCKIWLESMQ